MTPAPAPSRYQQLYRPGERNICPGCGGTHWDVGRLSAECANCGTPVMLADVSEQPERPRIRMVHRSKTAGGRI